MPFIDKSSSKSNNDLLLAWRIGALGPGLLKLISGDSIIIDWYAFSASYNLDSEGLVLSISEKFDEISIFAILVHSSLVEIDDIGNWCLLFGAWLPSWKSGFDSWLPAIKLSIIGSEVIDRDRDLFNLLPLGLSRSSSLKESFFFIN